MSRLPGSLSRSAGEGWGPSPRKRAEGADQQRPQENP
jgi:hypothetical protein